MKKTFVLTVILFVAAFAFAQNGKASKYLVYKEIFPRGDVYHVHVLAGEKLALVCSDLKIPNTIPFLDCDLVSRKPAGYKILHVVDGKEEIYVADVTMPKFNKISKKSIAECCTLDSALVAFFKKLAVENNYSDTVSLDEPVIMKFTPNIGTERIGDYECTIGTMQVSESYSWKIWYTKAMNYNWTFLDEVFWLVPGTVVRAEDSGNLVYELEKIEDSNFVLQETTESVREALRMFFNR
jgi:hypothetical protein